MKSYSTFERERIEPIGNRTPALSTENNQSNRNRIIFLLVVFFILLALFSITPLALLIATLSKLEYYSPIGLSPSSSASPASNGVQHELKIFITPIKRPLFGGSGLRENEEKEDEFFFYSYNSTIPGPLIVMHPGDTYKIIMVNELKSETPESSTLRVINHQFRYPNTTVTHFHGLHISPGGEGDNMFRVQHPDSRMVIKVALPADHPSGTYYMHPHFHGSSMVQAGYALACPILVKEEGNKFENRFEDVVLLFQLSGVGSHKVGDDVEEAFFATGSMMNKAIQQQQQQPVNPAAATTAAAAILVNGVKSPVSIRNLKRKKLYRIRIINACIDGTMQLVWKSTSSYLACDVKLIAKDGIYLRNGLLVDASSPNGHLLPPGGRVDYLIRLNDNQDDCQLKTIVNQNSAKRLGEKSKFLNGTLAIFTPSSSSSSGGGGANNEEEVVESFPEELPRLSEFLQVDLKTYRGIVERRSFEFNQFAGYSSMDPANTQAKYGINNQPYTEDVVKFSIRLGRVQEWVIINRLQDTHPFHMHTNHFQIVKDYLQLNNDHLYRDWRDTINIPGNGNVTIRFRPNHFVGKTLLHCHIFSHENMGMSMVFEIVPEAD